MCVCSPLFLSLFVLWSTYMMAGAGTASLDHEMQQGEPHGTLFLDDFMKQSELLHQLWIYFQAVKG